MKLTSSHSNSQVLTALYCMGPTSAWPECLSSLLTLHQVSIGVDFKGTVLQVRPIVVIGSTTCVCGWVYAGKEGGRKGGGLGDWKQLAVKASTGGKREREWLIWYSSLLRVIHKLTGSIWPHISLHPPPPPPAPSSFCTMQCQYCRPFPSWPLWGSCFNHNHAPFCGMDCP